jgi:hypothetical protein
MAGFLVTPFLHHLRHRYDHVHASNGMSMFVVVFGVQTHVHEGHGHHHHHHHHHSKKSQKPPKASHGQGSLLHFQAAVAHVCAASFSVFLICAHVWAFFLGETVWFEEHPLTPLQARAPPAFA